MLFGTETHQACTTCKGRVRVKICGLRNPEMANVAADAGADAIGLMFYASSPRYVAPAAANRIVAEVKGKTTIVGVFVNPAAAWLEEVLACVSLDAIQFHGDEEDGFCRQWGLPYIKALRLRQGRDYTTANDAWPGASAFLVDSYSPDAFGGTGELCDRELIPTGLNRPVILAGGLRPDNIGAAIARVKPWAVDVSSGVECERGVKDTALVEAFMREVGNVSGD